VRIRRVPRRQTPKDERLERAARCRRADARGYLLALGFRPPTNFLNACGFVMVAASRQRCCGFVASASRASQRRARHEGFIGFDLLADDANLDQLRDGAPSLF
jgi:hypothetical protein